MRAGFHGTSVEQVGAVALEVDALARGVGRDQDAHGVIGRRAVERALDLGALIVGHAAVEREDALVAEVAALDRGGQQLVQVALGVAVLGEDDHPGVGPLALGLGAGGAADRDRRALVGADPVEQRRDLGVGSGGVLRGQAAHLGQELGGAAGGAGQGRAGGGHRVGVGGLGRVVVGSVRVVVVGGGGGQVELQRGARAAGGDAGGVDLERAAERLDAGQQPLLQVDEHQLAAAALGAHQPGVLGEQHRQPEGRASPRRRRAGPAPGAGSCRRRAGGGRPSGAAP
jgi:hypothetical protein